MGLLQAGAGVKGEFENRLKSVIQEVKSSPQPIIMFIDEAHTLIGAGGGAGQSDAANLLKPALARGELRTIAATTWAEYKKYFEKDPALTRRFQVVKVEEPTEQSAIEMMRGLTETLESHHKVRILNEAVVDDPRRLLRQLDEQRDGNDVRRISRPELPVVHSDPEAGPVVRSDDKDRIVNDTKFGETIEETAEQPVRRRRLQQMAPEPIVREHRVRPPDIAR